MKPPFITSLTTEWHNDTYPDIDPKRPELSVIDKTVIISGGGTGIGRETTRAFAQAGASRVVIFGRREAPLQETKTLIESEIKNVQILPVSADITNYDSMKQLAQQVGEWDVLILNSGYCADLVTVEHAQVDDWWYGFEVNVKGGFIACQTLLPTRRPGAKVVATQSGQFQMPTPMQNRASSYGPAKAASTKMFEIFADEVKDVDFFNLHPGVVETDMKAKVERFIDMEGERGYMTDSVQLPAHFAVWLASPEAAFLRGRFIWCNWDVTELKAMEDEIKDTELLKVNVLGWPLKGALSPATKWIRSSDVRS